MKNNNTNHQKVGGLVRRVSLISLLAMSSSAFAKNIEYQITLGSPAVVDTNAEHVTFHINFAEPVSGLTLQRFQLFNDAMSSTLASLVQAPNSSTLYHLKVNTAGTGARISAYARNSGDANSPVTPVTDASGEVVTLTLPVNVPLATYIIDKTPPGAPTIAEPIYSLTQDPVIKGVAESGTRLTVVSAPGNQTCTVDVGGDGKWECNLVPTLPVGLATLSATTVDKAGNRSDPGQRNLHVLSSGGDEDNDGITNQDEINRTGTNPLMSDTDGDGVNDLIEVGSDLNNPKKAAGAAKIDALSPLNDSDGDGLSNQHEITLGSNPMKADSDGDGIPDGTEVTGGTNPNSTDSDNDGISDGLELQLGLNPNLADSNNNGVNDGDEDSDSDNLPNAVELALGLNPAKNDTDGDGKLDGEEDFDGDGLPNQVEAQLGLNPAVADTDGDGVSDYNEDNDGDTLSNGLEVITGLNPNNPDSDGDGHNDSVDVDWDNDGINNDDEIPFNMLIDSDNDGVPVYLDDNDQDATIRDNDGKVHFYFDHDRDGILNQLDPDDDGDGINTITETASADSDADGIPDYLEPNNRDSDGDGVNDYLDNNDDGDNIASLSEVGAGGYRKLNDVDNDGIPDYLDGDQLNAAGMADGSGDSDSNGISDKKDCNTGRICPDLDRDGIADYLDKDDDGDGVSDVDEIGGDPARPRDSNGNGVSDYREQSVAANTSTRTGTGTAGTAGTVDTALSGGGSAPLFWLMLISPLVWLRRGLGIKK